MFKFYNKKISRNIISFSILFPHYYNEEMKWNSIKKFTDGLQKKLKHLNVGGDIFLSQYLFSLKLDIEGDKKNIKKIHQFIDKNGPFLYINVDYIKQINQRSYKNNGIKFRYSLL